MTTKSTNPTSRETTAFVRDKGLRPVIVTVHGGLIELRAKGLRTREVVDVSSVYYRAVKNRIAFERMEKAKARKARGGGR